MVARISGFESRSDLKMIQPRSRSTNITPGNGGVAVHWGGPRQNINTHAQCRTTWLGWQRFHMVTHGWVDLAYSFGFCNHGYVFAGRGLGVRTAANGTNFGNQNYYAAVWIGGENNAITSGAFDALEWIVLEARKAGAGSRVRGHTDFTGSQCAGTILNKRAEQLDNNPIFTVTTPTVTTTEEEDEDVFVRIANGNTVYQAVGELLFPQTRARMEALLGNVWRDKVKSIDESEAKNFRICPADVGRVVQELSRHIPAATTPQGFVFHTMNAADAVKAEDGWDWNTSERHIERK